MPNTFAHIGVQTLISRWLFGSVDVRWIWLGAIIPDIPWVLQRVVRVLDPGIDQLELRAYVVVQATLLFSVLLSAALSMLAQRKGQTFLVVMVGCLLHLLLDASQTKWGNGVQLFAPFDWTVMNFGWYWPESWITYGLTALGVLIALVSWRVALTKPLELDVRTPTLILGLLLLGLYFAGPKLFLEQVFSADAHYINTMRHQDRLGKPLAFDRRTFSGEHGQGAVTLYGEQIELEGVTFPGTKNATDQAEMTISIQGRFISDSRVLVSNCHLHHGQLRNALSLLGFLLVIGSLLVGLYRWLINPVISHR